MKKDGRPHDDFKKFYEDFFPGVYALMQRCTQEKDVSWDLAQEAFLKLYERWQEFDDIENAQAFIYTIARNLYANYYRREKLKAEVYANLEVDEIDDNNYLKAVTSVETERILYKAIDQLPPQTRTIILMNLKEKNNTEIAQDLGISVNTVKTLKKAAYKTLRDLITKDYWWIIFIKFYC